MLHYRTCGLSVALLGQDYLPSYLPSTGSVRGAAGSDSRGGRAAILAVGLYVFCVRNAGLDRGLLPSGDLVKKSSVFLGIADCRNGRSGFAWAVQCGDDAVLGDIDVGHYERASKAMTADYSGSYPIDSAFDFQD